MKCPSPPKKTHVFKLAAEIAPSYHERWDGSGYPFGLAGEDIPESGRIVALADVFDALTTKRPYKQPWPVADAIAEILRRAGSQFDPTLVDVFHTNLGAFEQLKQRWDEQDA